MINQELQGAGGAQSYEFSRTRVQFLLSRVGIIVDYLRDYSVVNGVQHIFQYFFSFNLRNYIFHSAMTSFHVDLNEAAKCIDHTASLLIAPSPTRTECKMATIFSLNYDDSLTNL